MRTEWRQELRTKGVDAEFRDEYAINNQYDHCDYVFICNGDFNGCWCKEKGYKKCKKK